MIGRDIYSYSRKQAIADGVLVELPEKIVKEAGYKCGVACTNLLWNEYIKPTKKLEDSYGQSIDGRLWDVLSVLRMYAKQNSSNLLFFKVIFWIEEENGKCKQKKVDIKCVAGPDDESRLCLTLMLPFED